MPFFVYVSGILLCSLSWNRHHLAELPWRVDFRLGLFWSGCRLRKKQQQKTKTKTWWSTSPRRNWTVLKWLLIGRKKARWSTSPRRNPTNMAIVLWIHDADARFLPSGFYLRCLPCLVTYVCLHCLHTPSPRSAPRPACHCRSDVTSMAL